MYIIYASLLLIVLVYFGTTIFTVISSVKSNSNNKVSIGNIWFVGLLIINLILISFTCTFYYYKSKTIGNKGTTGHKGFDGQPGEGCLIPISNGICKM
jgi:hypothetical protein